tara:strand:+ start:246 stop:359 length:114 start_codon:yes stop_codon:yes gene_type:complete
MHLKRAKARFFCFEGQKSAEKAGKQAFVAKESLRFLV